MADKTIHIIGAGIAGLSAAMEIVKSKKSCKVIIYEAANKAGGRCFSFYDKDFDTMLDNGTHMILGANKNTLNFIKTINALDLFAPVDPIVFPFIDLKTTNGWLLKPNKNFIPLWLLSSAKRVPNTSIFDYLKAIKLKTASSNATVFDILGKDEVLYKNLWEPLCIATLNTIPQKASAKLFWKVVSKSLLKGGKSMQPYIAKKSLKGALIDPAVKWLKENDVDINLSCKLDGLGIEIEVRELVFSDISKTLQENDKVILATSVQNTSKLLPTVHFPYIYKPIINAHFKVDDSFSLPGNVPLLGIINGSAQWIFHKGNTVSVTISAASDEMKLTAEDIARRTWIDICNARKVTGETVPPFKIVKEKRATIEHSPDMENLRRPNKTKLENLIVAGDWTETGLPCTIEGAIISGKNAAQIALNEK